MSVLSDQVTLWIVNVLIHTTVLTGLLLLIALSFRKRAAMRYWILCCGLLLVLISPAISAVIQSRGNSLLALKAPSNTPDTATQDSGVVLPSAVDASAAAADLTTAANPGRRPKSLPSLEPAIDPEIARGEMRPELVSAPAETTESTAASAEEPQSFMQWVVTVVYFATLIWAVGAALLLLRMAVAWVRLSRILRRAHPIENAGFQAAFTRACAAVGCHQRQTPRLKMSDEITGPIAAGIFGGSVVLPRQLMAQAEPSELADVLIHEVAHVVRRDQIIALLQNLVSAIYWPHPVVRKLNRELAKAREEVCDNFVLASTDAPVYGRTLLSLAQLIRQPETIPGSVGFFASRWKLEHRVAGLLDQDRDKKTFLSKRGWAFVLASMFALLAVVSVGTVTIATATDVNSDSSSDAGIESITIRGIVRGPDNRPMAEARVIALENFVANSSWTNESFILAETISDDSGRYTLTVRSNEQRFSNGQYLESKHISVLAVKSGYGPDEQRLQEDKPQTDLKLATASREIIGQIVDLEGRPIEGVEIDAIDFAEPPRELDPADLVGKWIEAARKNPTGTDRESTAFGDNSTVPRVASFPAARSMRGIAVLGIQTKTDRDGRFRLSGMGDDRRVTLKIVGTQIATSLIPVVTREFEAVHSPELGPIYRTSKTFGTRFRCIAEPSQIVQGQVRDTQTGEPISGATISLHQLPGDLLGIDGFLSATSDEHGNYVLAGLPRNTEQSGGSIRIKVNPPSDQPYFRSEHRVPMGEGLEPIKFDIDLTRGVWATGQVADQETGKPITGLVGYHPFIDNPNASNHEAFDPNVTSMGYDEMFATNNEGRFRVPALLGSGILRVVASDADEFELQAIPGTSTDAPGRIQRGDRRVYHTIMPGNAVVELTADSEAELTGQDIKLRPLKTLDVHVVNPDGSDATGFRVAGRRIAGRVTLTGRGWRYWEQTPCAKPTIRVVLGNAQERSRPLIVMSKDNRLGAVLWLSDVDVPDGQSLTVKLEPTARIVGQLKHFNQEVHPRPQLQAGIGDAGKINAMFPGRRGYQIKVSKHLPFRIEGAGGYGDDGTFDLVVPASDRLTLMLSHFPGDPLLLDNARIDPGSKIDFGTIDLRTDPESWPKPTVSVTNAGANSAVKEPEKAN